MKALRIRRLLSAPLLMLLKAAIFFPEGFGSGALLARLTHAIIKSISAENNARIKQSKLQYS